MLLLIPQRYEFSSKSQHPQSRFCSLPVVADTTKVRIFKQITTAKVKDFLRLWLLLIPQRYEFSSKSQPYRLSEQYFSVVADTTKVRIFKQITTHIAVFVLKHLLLLIPQRYEFSSKSQHYGRQKELMRVVADTTKVRIFKQITTISELSNGACRLLLIPQRYEFSSKSQRLLVTLSLSTSCC